MKHYVYTIQDSFRNYEVIAPNQKLAKRAVKDYSGSYINDMTVIKREIAPQEYQRVGAFVRMIDVYSDEVLAERQTAPEEEQATAETETAQVAETKNTYEHAVEIKADKYLDMIQGVEQMGKYRYRYTVAEDFCIDVTICTHDLKDKNDLMHHWKKAGYVSEVSETHLALDCYYTDLEGNCWGRYNPTIKKGKLDFEWVLPYTAENVEKLLTEAIKRYVEDSGLCVVDLNDEFAHIYSTVKDGEDWFDAVDRAFREAHENAETCRKWMQKYPENADYWEARVEEYENADYHTMRYSDFERIQRERILKKPLQEVTEDDYEEMLNILPPIHWVEINGVSEFCMMEMYTGTYTNQYAHDRKTGKYYQKLVDVTDRDTWIHKILERGGA